MRPRRPARNPPEGFGFSRVQVHHWSAGTEALTWSMCWPQPAQVVFPQLLHFTGRHMVFPFGSPASLPGGGRGVLPPRIPPGVSEGQGFGPWRATFCAFRDILQPKTGCVWGGQRTPLMFCRVCSHPSRFAEFDVGNRPKSGIKLCKTHVGGGVRSLAMLGARGWVMGVWVCWSTGL